MCESISVGQVLLKGSRAWLCISCFPMVQTIGPHGHVEVASANFRKPHARKNSKSIMKGALKLPQRITGSGKSLSPRPVRQSIGGAKTTLSRSTHVLQHTRSLNIWKSTGQCVKAESGLGSGCLVMQARKISAERRFLLKISLVGL